MEVPGSIDSMAYGPDPTARSGCAAISATPNPRFHASEMGERSSGARSCTASTSVCFARPGLDMSSASCTTLCAGRPTSKASRQSGAYSSKTMVIDLPPSPISGVRVT